MIPVNTEHHNVGLQVLQLPKTTYNRTTWNKYVVIPFEQYDTSIPLRERVKANKKVHLPVLKLLYDKAQVKREKCFQSVRLALPMLLPNKWISTFFPL